MVDPRQAAIRGRGHRADEQNAVDFAGRQRSRVPRDHLRSDEDRVRRADARADRRRRRRAAYRNHHRHAQREGRARGRGGSGSRRPGAPHPLGHHYRSQRTHAGGTNDRRVLGLGDAREAAGRGPQLCARRARNEALPGGVVPCGDDLRQQLSECRPAECVRRVRSTPARNRRARLRLRHQQLREHRRRLLRNDARSHSRDCSTGRRRAAAPDSDTRRTPIVQVAAQPVRGPRSAGDQARQQLPDDRRAHQRDRLEEIPAADQRRQVRRGGRRRAAIRCAAART